jgi:hypothetical protein
VRLQSDGELVAYVVFERFTYLNMSHTVYVARRDGGAPPIELHEFQRSFPPTLLGFTLDSGQLLIRSGERGSSLLTVPVDGSAAASTGAWPSPRG